MAKKNKRLFIIDGYAILYRAHYALIRNPLITSYGFHTSALFGFSNHLIKIIKDENPDYLVCAFDSKEKTFRHKMYSKYKANRPEMPEELQAQIPHLWELLKGMNIPVLKKPGFEADDIIGTITQSMSNKEIESYIVSGDKDFMQLINDKVFLYTPGKRNASPDIYDREGVINKWGLPPEKIIDLLALMGDSSDNVPGVAGVGVKTAVKLLKEYDNIESVLDNASKISNKRVHNGLVNGKDDAYLSKDLVTIVKDVDVDTTLDSFILKSFDQESLGKKFEELEFYALLKYLAIDSPSSTMKKVDKNYSTILNIDDLKKMVSNILNAQFVSVDLETTSVDPMVAQIVGISISFEKNSGFYIPIEYPEKTKNNFVSGKKIEYGLIPLGALGMVVFSCLMSLEDPPKVWAYANIGGLGFFGGFYLIPILAMIQQRPDKKDKGTVVAASSMLTFVGIFLSALIYYFLTSSDFWACQNPRPSWLLGC